MLQSEVARQKQQVELTMRQLKVSRCFLHIGVDYLCWDMQVDLEQAVVACDQAKHDAEEVCRYDVCSDN